MASQASITPPGADQPTGLTTQQEGAAIANAAQKYNVPVNILLGIFGAESSYGTAYGPGQTTFGYFGLTAGEWNPSDNFQQDADIAAQTLANLYKQTGSWDAALEKYSGGSYGLAHVTQEADSAPKALATAIGEAVQKIRVSGGLIQTGIGDIAGAVSGAANSVGSAVSSAASVGTTIAGAFSWLTTPANWLRILEVAGGAVLIYMALKALTGVDTPTGGATRIVKAATKVAE